jgi:dynein heavy chain, axonemal
MGTLVCGLDCWNYAEFKPLAEWHRDRTLFQLLSNIAFFQHSALQHCFTKWYQAKRRAAFRRIRAAIAERLFHAKPHFITALMDVAATVHKLSSVDFINTTPHTYHTLQEYSDLQSGQRENKVRPEIDAVFDTVEHRIHVRPLILPSRHGPKSP